MCPSHLQQRAPSYAIFRWVQFTRRCPVRLSWMTFGARTSRCESTAEYTSLRYFCPSKNARLVWKADTISNLAFGRSTPRSQACQTTNDCGAARAEAVRSTIRGSCRLLTFKRHARTRVWRLQNADEEMIEACLQALESFVARCPKEVFAKLGPCQPFSGLSRGLHTPIAAGRSLPIRHLPRCPHVLDLRSELRG